MKPVLLGLLLNMGVSAFSASPFVPGYYYQTDGIRVDGLIRLEFAKISLFSNRPSYLVFKKEKGAHSVRLTVKEVKAFVIGTDSFALVHNVKVNNQKGRFPAEFARVIQKGRLNLLVETCVVYGGRYGTTRHPYILSRNEDKFLCIWNAKRQRDALAEYFSDDPALRLRILNKEFDKDIPGLVAADDLGK
jgi:hypothetical protein